jgi:TRAP-type C4-dicarboxylate transport system permease small subunit
VSGHGLAAGHEEEAPATALGRIARGIERTVTPVYKAIGALGAAVMALVLGSMCYSAIAKQVGQPLDGYSDIVELGLLLMLTAGMGLEHLGHEKMTVEVISVRLPKKMQAVLAPIIFLLVVVVLAIAVWRLVDYGIAKQSYSETTAGLLLPKAPFVFLLAFGVFTLIPIYLSRLLASIDRLVKR